MPSDLMRQLGALAFASRLKRLGDRLQRDVSRLYRAQEIDFQARWFPVAYLLQHQPSLSVTAIANRLGLTHVAVNQISEQMARRGLLMSKRDHKDKRRRLLSLTPKGRKTVASLRTLWRSIEKCTRKMIESSGHDILAGMIEIEKALDRRDMYDQVTSDMEHEKQP